MIHGSDSESVKNVLTTDSIVDMSKNAMQNRIDMSIISKKKSLSDMKKSRNRNIKNDKKGHKSLNENDNNFYSNKNSREIQNFIHHDMIEDNLIEGHAKNEESPTVNIQTLSPIIKLNDIENNNTKQLLVRRNK